MLHKLLIAFILTFVFALISIFGVQAAQLATFSTKSNAANSHEYFSSQNHQFAEQKAKKMSFFEKILFKKAIKKINKTLGIKESKFNESVTRIGVIIAGIGLAAWILGYVIIIALFSSSSSSAAGTAAAALILTGLGFLANIIGVIIAVVGISIK